MERLNKNGDLMFYNLYNFNFNVVLIRAKVRTSIKK